MRRMPDSMVSVSLVDGWAMGKCVVWCGVRKGPWFYRVECTGFDLDVWFRTTFRRSIEDHLAVCITRTTLAGRLSRIPRFVNHMGKQAYLETYPSVPLN